jgi:CDP-diacylglycerol--glycerol-3-phosphate 3-phosphatidyltransferase
MQRLWLAIQRGYLRIIEPFVAWLVKAGVGPNTITTVGTLTYMVGGAIYASGHIKTAGWWLGLTAMFDVLDGKVARASGKTTVFGAFYDSTLDRVADGAVLGGLLIFFARNDVLHGVPHWAGTPMVVLTLLGIIGTFLTSYTRARAEALGIDAKVGMMQRPERVTLLSAPQAFFGLALGGWVLMLIVALLSVTAWITAVQRMVYVHRVTQPLDHPERPLDDRTVTPELAEVPPRGRGPHS